MDLHPRRHIPIPGTHNIRDLGGYSTGTAETLWRQVLRADGLHRLDQSGMARLIEEGVATVIDLRSTREVEAQPNPLQADERVRYHHVSLFENLAPIYGPQTDTLFELYVRALAERREAICTVLTLIAEAEEGAVLFHCTAGKDRTGLIAALLLANAGVTAQTIAEDYTLTGHMIASLIEEIVENAALHDLGTEQMRALLACPPGTMIATLAHLDNAHGSVAAYLAQAGVPAVIMDRLRSRLLGKS